MLSEQKSHLNAVPWTTVPQAWVAHPNVIPLDVLFEADIIPISLLLDVFHILSTWINASKLFIWMWIWGRKPLLTDMSGLGWRLYPVHLLSALKVLQGLCHQEGSTQLGQICFPLVSVEGEYSLSTDTFFIFLLSLGARTIHHLMNHRFPGRILRFVPHSIQMAKNLQSGQRSGKKT